jgi:hypothetical protein
MEFIYTDFLRIISWSILEAGPILLAFMKLLFAKLKEKKPSLKESMGKGGRREGGQAARPRTCPAVQCSAAQRNVTGNKAPCRESLHCERRTIYIRIRPKLW